MAAFKTQICQRAGEKQGQCVPMPEEGRESTNLTQGSVKLLQRIFNFHVFTPVEAKTKSFKRLFYSV